VVWLAADECPQISSGLARRVHPADEFWKSWPRPARSASTSNGRLAEFTSYQVPGTYPKMLVSLRSMELTPAFNF